MCKIKIHVKSSKLLYFLCFTCFLFYFYFACAGWSLCCWLFLSCGQGGDRRYLAAGVCWLLIACCLHSCGVQAAAVMCMCAQWSSSQALGHRLVVGARTWLGPSLWTSWLRIKPVSLSGWWIMTPDASGRPLAFIFKWEFLVSGKNLMKEM